jgi:uncharacterized membrane protein YwzB
MTPKFILYIFVSALVVWSLESVNINAIFKKNRVLKARIFYFLLGLSMIYLITNFIYDIFLSIKLV